MAEHTRGPWFASGRITSKKRWIGGVVSANNGAVLTSGSVDGLHGKPSVMQANARLIAAGPDLLKACRAMLHCTGGSKTWKGETHDALVLIEAAIAKATTGGTP